DAGERGVRGRQGSLGEDLVGDRTPDTGAQHGRGCRGRRAGRGCARRVAASTAKVVADDPALARELSDVLNQARNAGISVTAAGERAVAVGGSVGGVMTTSDQPRRGA